jgi:UDP-2-acetamido-3-amino-2,3-dideoxy-glucuronate N-acetyltransferase
MNSLDPFIHHLADVRAEDIGYRTKVWQFTVILQGAQIGEDCNICSHCFIESDVMIGSRVTIKNGVQIWDGLRIADDVFIGPNVTFCNDKHPKSKNKNFSLLKTYIDEGVVIGAGAVILPGITLGKQCIVGAGAVVTHDVPAHSTVVGNPARNITQ